MTSAISCFNCEGAGIEIFFPHIQMLVECNASKWILSPEIESFISGCPYCDPPKDDAAFLLLWPGPAY